MSTTTDLITAAVLFGPGIAGAAAIAHTWRGAATDSAAIQQVLAESAAERAARVAVDGAAPPDGGEGAPAPVAEQAARLATVIPFPAQRDRRAA
ncbi:hypothetical protein ACWEQL_19400 [Kitasatospora sp. NPDC004240]